MWSGFRKTKPPRKLKPRPKYPQKVHIWTAISSYGLQHVIAGFWMPLSVSLSLLKLIDSNRTTIQNIQAIIYETSFSHLLFSQFHKVVEDPDLNPTENMWCFLKYYLRHQYK